MDDFEKRIDARLRRETGKAVLNEISTYADIAGKKILDVGSGWGEVSVELANAGANVIGVEPDNEVLRISQLLASMQKSHVKFIHGYAESLPFPDESFDIVVCNDVLEHVQDVDKSLSEMIRVVKVNGLAYLATANYSFPREGHYKVLAPTMLPKKLIKLYIRMIGRNPDYVDTLQFVTARQIISKLKRYNVIINNIGLKNYIKKNKGNVIKSVLKNILAVLGLYSETVLLLRKCEKNNNL